MAAEGENSQSNANEQKKYSEDSIKKELIDVKDFLVDFLNKNVHESDFSKEVVLEAIKIKTKDLGQKIYRESLDLYFDVFEPKLKEIETEILKIFFDSNDDFSLKEEEVDDFRADDDENGSGDPPDIIDRTQDRERESFDPLIIKFFQLPAISGNLWEKEDVEGWGSMDFVRAIVTYVARDLSAEAHPAYPMASILGQAVEKQYPIQGEPQKYSLKNDILPLFNSIKIRDEVEWFFNGLGAMEKSASSIEKARKDGAPDPYFNYLKDDFPAPISWINFFRSDVEIDGQRDKLGSFGSPYGFGELAAAVTRILLRRVVDPNQEERQPGSSDYNLFAHDAKREEIIKELRSKISLFVQEHSLELQELDSDSEEIRQQKKQKADIMGFLAVEYAAKFTASLVPWPISDLKISRYDSLIPTKLFRFGPSERKYLTEEGQSGKLSVYDKLFIAHFGRLLENPLTGIIVNAKFLKKNNETGEVEEGSEYLPLLELMLSQFLVVSKKQNITELSEDDQGEVNDQLLSFLNSHRDVNIDVDQGALLESFGKVYIDSLPSLIGSNIKANQNDYWSGMITHAQDIWGLIKSDSLPMKTLTREVSSPGIFKDFKATVPSEDLKNDLANIYKRIDYWMGDSIIKDKDGNAQEFTSLELARKADPDNRFMKLRVKRGERDGASIYKWILMNFREAFIINPAWDTKLAKELDISEKEIEFLQKDVDRLYKDPGDQYQVLRKLISEKFVISSIRHYLSSEANKNYLDLKEKLALSELLSSDWVKFLDESDPLRRFLVKRKPVWLGEAYPDVSVGVWTKEEVKALLDVFPEEPPLYAMNRAIKKEKGK